MFGLNDFDKIDDEYLFFSKNSIYLDKIDDMKDKKFKPLTDVEWTTCWMSIRYAMNRQTIASATLPGDIIKNYYNRFSDYQKKSIVNDLKGENFGNEIIDKPIWSKFLASCDVDNHYDVKLTDGSIHRVFEANDRIYSLNFYITYPHKEIFCPREVILEIIKK